MQEDRSDPFDGAPDASDRTASTTAETTNARAQVFQVDSNTGPSSLLVSVTVENPGRFESWTDQVLLVLECPALGAGIDNDDIIDFWGDVAGSFSYEARLGTNTVPSVEVKYLTLIEKRTE